MSFVAATGNRPPWAACRAAHGERGHPLPAVGELRPNCQLAEQVLRYLPSRGLPSPIASVSQGAVEWTNLSGITGGSGDVKMFLRKREVRQVSERTPHLPIQGGSTASRAALRLKAVAAQHASIKIGGFDFPAVRLVRAASEAAA